nr:hypothetical protein [Tanacetum cinerariifolium]
MATTIMQQVAMDEALVPSTQRLRIRRSNFRLLSDIPSKKSILQLVYDVLRKCPFFKAFLVTADAFLVTADVPEIYMQEFWATAYVHQHSIRFKMNNKKHILDLESFRNMLHIYLRVQGQTFAELPFEEEILDFIRFLGHSAIIRTLIDRRRDDDNDQDEGPSTGSDRGSKRRREGKELKSASSPLETTTRSAGRSTTGSKLRQASTSESAFVEEPVQTTSQIEEPSHPVFEIGAEDQPIVQSSQHPEWFSQLKKPLTSDRD